MAENSTLTEETTVTGVRSRCRRGAIGLSAAALLFAACAGDDAAQPADDAWSAGDGPAVWLDIETLQAETPQGIVTATEVPNAFVGAVTDDLYVGIVITEEGTQYDQYEFIAYLCDSTEIAKFMFGNLSDGETMIGANRMDLAFEVGDDEITGSVWRDGEELGSFTAVPSDDESGLFYALADSPIVEPASFGNHPQRVGPPGYVGGWIILNATMQQGFWWGWSAEEEEELQM